MTDWRKLVEEALFLRQNGERPPGAPRDNPQAETWRDWDSRAEAALRDAVKAEPPTPHNQERQP